MTVSKTRHRTGALTHFENRRSSPLPCPVDRSSCLLECPIRAFRDHGVTTRQGLVRSCVPEISVVVDDDSDAGGVGDRGVGRRLRQLQRERLVRFAEPLVGLVTQNVQRALLIGTAFVVSAYLQVVRGYNAIQTGVIFTAATGGILVSSLAAERLAKRYAQRTLIVAGFVTTVVGIAILLALVKGTTSAWAFTPGLLLLGLGVGVMLTPSVNVVQSAFAERQQGEISGLSRCISNLGSSLGTAIAGTILASNISKTSYAAAMITLALFGGIGLGAALLLPTNRAQRP